MFDFDDDDNLTVLGRALDIAQTRQEPTGYRLDAIRFIIDQFESKFFPILEGILNDDTEHPDVRSAAALALGKIGGDSALSTLLRHVHSSDITVKNYTMQALGLLGRTEGIPFLIEALRDDNNTVFASAAQALGEIGRPVVPHLMALLTEHDNPDVKDDARCIAAWQLGLLRYTEAVPALLGTVKDEPNAEVAALSIWALGEIGYGSEDVLETLNWAKIQADPALSQRARMALRKIARHLN